MEGDGFFMDRLVRAFRLFCYGVAGIGGAAFLVMMLSTVSDVTGRYVFNKPIPGTTELNETFMIAVVYMGLAYTQILRGHVNMEFVVSRLSPRTREIFQTVTIILSLAVFGFIAAATSEAAYDSWLIKEFHFGIVEFPIWPAKMLVPLGCYVMSIQLLIDAVGSGKKAMSFKKKG